MALIIILIIVIGSLAYKLRQANIEIEALRNTNPYDLDQNGVVDNSDLSKFMKGYNKHKQ
jgi:hypothetical protein